MLAFCVMKKAEYKWSICLLLFALLCPKGLFAQTTYTSMSMLGSQVFQVSVIANRLHVISDIENLGNGNMLIAERGGAVYTYRDGIFDATPYHVFRNIYAVGQGGLLDVVPDPQYRLNKLLYAVYTVETRAGIVTRLSRFKDGVGGWADEKILYDADPVGANKHYGSAVVILPDGTLLFSLGERGNLDLAQDQSTLHGKLIRLTRDGGIPRDNPFVGRAGILPEIYSYGHRNPQGLAVHPVTGSIYGIEHGPSGYDRAGGGDEINLIQPGANYGWPIIHHSLERAGMITPIVEYTPAIAPSMGLFYTSQWIPTWTNNLFVANLRGQSILRMKLEKDRVVEQEFLLEGEFGRIRALGVDDYGHLFIGTSNGDLRGRDQVDMVLMVIPQNEDS